MENSISSFRNSRSILKLESERLALWVWKCHIDLESLRLEFYAKKKNFTYSGVFKPYNDVLKPYSGVFLQNFFFFISSRFREPYSGVFKPYSDVLKPYSGFFAIYGNRVSKTRFSHGFFSTSDPSSYKSRLKNSSFILELKF